MIFKNINLTIKKGDRVGFIGDTGSGKSTLLDLIMGLLQPSKGTLDVDGYSIRVESLPSWQAHIAHVPQTVFLADTTIVENIAFGVDKINIDYDKVVQAATQAQISSFINNLPDKYQTTVGERGVKISGGQRQRIGIARALYKQADVIVFDEATSALDEQTEREVMKSIDSIGNNITLLIIAHRLSTLKNCNKLVKIVHNNVEVINDVNHLIEKNKEDKLKRGMKLN
jgi:ATP-binding cassette subfamily B protein